MEGLWGRPLAFALCLTIVAGVFAVALPTRTTAQTLPSGPWVDQLVWEEAPDLAFALERVKADDGDLLMYPLAEAASIVEAFESPEVLTISTFGSVNGLLFNPNEQKAGVPWNPFTDAQIREAMNWLIDREFLVREIVGGFALPYVVPFNPKVPDYFLELDLFNQLEDAYAPDFPRAQNVITERMLANGASIGPSGYWEDTNGDIIDLHIFARLEDERLEIGNYVAERLRLVGFKVTVSPKPSSDAIPVVYGGDPSLGAWHVYTEGWSFPNVAWDDNRIWTYHDCVFEPFCARFGAPGTYSPPADFDTLSEDLAFARYSSLEERQQMIRGLAPRTLSEANYRMWLVALQGVYPINDRLESFAWDVFGGPTRTFTLESAKLLPDQPGVDPATGIGGSLHILNFIMFNDAWNPWHVGWLYDAVQLWALTDEGMERHPRTGRWIDYRAIHDVETVGPLKEGEACPPAGNASCIPIPPDAMVWELFRDPITGDVTGDGDRFVNVASGSGALSKVTTRIPAPGKWHTGMDITMDDILYWWSNAYRRAFGDISEHDPRAAGFDEQHYLSAILKGVRVVNTQTVEAYIDYWHVDNAEIARQGDLYPTGLPVSWEIAEVASQTVLDDVAALHENTAIAQGKIHVDLGRNPNSIAALDSALASLRAANHVPQGMGPWITPEEASARYEAAEDFRDNYGHWYAGNGPFLLKGIDAPLRQTVMTAFRDGYPFTAGRWDFLTESDLPEFTFGSFPQSLLAGTGATLAFTSTLAGERSDPHASRWFVRELATGFIMLRDEPVRTGVGEFEVQLLSTETVGLESGAYELVVVIQGVSRSVVRSFAFNVQSQLDFFGALFDELDDRLAELSDQTAQLGDSVDAVQGEANALYTLLIAVLALAVIAILVPSAMTVMIVRRSPP